jgi:hypothetical protein
VDPEAVYDEDTELLENVVPACIIRCKNCGAEDAYELTQEAYTPLIGGLMMAEEADSIDEMRVAPVLPQLLDGTPVERPSKVIRYLEELTEDNPESGEAWRRLGNACEKFSEFEKAEEAWRTAVEVDETEAEAAFSLAAMLWNPLEANEAPGFALMALERLPHAEIEGDNREAMVWHLVDMLQGITENARPPLVMTAVWGEEDSDEMEVANISDVDLRRVKRWERLEDLLVENRFREIRFHHEVPEDPPTLLEKFINRPRREPFDISALDGSSSPLPNPGQIIAEEDEKVGRNDPCPCGSGRKYKHCCGHPGKNR